MNAAKLHNHSIKRRIKGRSLRRGLWRGVVLFDHAAEGLVVFARVEEGHVDGPGGAKGEEVGEGETGRGYGCDGLEGNGACGDEEDVAAGVDVRRADALEVERLRGQEGEGAGLGLRRILRRAGLYWS